MVVDERRVQTQAPAAESPPDHSHDIYTIANIVTVLRLILVPFFFAVLINGSHDTLAFLLFAVAASTDWLDGQIARRTGTVTVIGKAIDPLVDRLLIAAGVLGLYIERRLPLWVVVVLFARDAYLMYGAWRLEQFHHRRMPVTFAGKVTTAVLLTGFADLILGWPLVPGVGLTSSQYLPGAGNVPTVLGTWFVYAGVALSLGTALNYTMHFRKIVSEGASA
jgi:cardiolipin synthase (CMP-forming)